MVWPLELFRLGKGDGKVGKFVNFPLENENVYIVISVLTEATSYSFLVRIDQRSCPSWSIPMRGGCEEEIHCWE